MAAGSGSRAPVPARQAAAAATSKAEPGHGQTEQEPTAAASCPDSRIAAVAANLAFSIDSINSACHDSEELQTLLDPACVTGKAWGVAIAQALETLAGCFEPEPPDMPPQARLFAFLAADSLSMAALKLLQRFVAADLQDPQQYEIGARLMHALAAMLGADRGVTAPCFEVRCLPRPAAVSGLCCKASSVTVDRQAGLGCSFQHLPSRLLS